MINREQYDKFNELISDIRFNSNLSQKEERLLFHITELKDQFEIQKLDPVPNYSNLNLKELQEEYNKIYDQHSKGINNTLKIVKIKEEICDRGMNTCDKCDKIMMSEYLNWISSEDFIPKEDEIISLQILKKYDALCEECYKEVILG